MHNNEQPSTADRRPPLVPCPLATHRPTLSRPAGAGAGAGAGGAGTAEGLLAADERDCAPASSSSSSSCAPLLAAVSAMGGDLDVRRLPPFPSGGRCMALSQSARGEGEGEEKGEVDAKERESGGGGCGSPFYYFCRCSLASPKSDGSCKMLCDLSSLALPSGACAYRDSCGSEKEQQHTGLSPGGPGTHATQGLHPIPLPYLTRSGSV